VIPALVYNSAYLSLVTFGVIPSLLRDILIRMALADDTVTGLAVFYALLAFSSLRLNGLHQQALQLKISALHYLSASAEKGQLSLAEAAQHVAASMLLSTFEVGNGDLIRRNPTIRLTLYRS
jgi:hypothetical protein